ncbi:hypothetical protein [Piscirickettsia salmonis]|nr:hypothetical protein [Piscirickettsia salmonis]
MTVLGEIIVPMVLNCMGITRSLTVSKVTDTALGELTMGLAGVFNK